MINATVARVQDVSSYEQLLSVLKKLCKNIETIDTDGQKIIEFDKTVPENLQPFKGTMKIIEYDKTVPEHLQPFKGTVKIRQGFLYKKFPDALNFCSLN